MNRPTQFNFTFNIDHFSAAQAGCCGDAGGLSKTEFTQLQHRKAIDLAGYLAFGINQYGAAVNILVKLFSDFIQSADFMINGLLHIADSDMGMTVVLRPVIGLG